jgi:putative holliday junction resolvase
LKDNNLKYYLAIDWGSKKVGLAVADNETRIASALKTVESGKAMNFILDLTRSFSFEKFIVGTYLKEDKFSQNDGKISKFINDLEKISDNIEIELVYEGFSSKIAQANLKEKGSRLALDDAESARVILQDWLDKKSGK